MKAEVKDSIMFPFPNLFSLLDLIIVAINGNCMDDTYSFWKQLDKCLLFLDT